MWLASYNIAQERKLTRITAERDAPPVYEKHAKSTTQSKVWTEIQDLAKNITTLNLNRCPLRNRLAKQITMYCLKFGKFLLIIHEPCQNKQVTRMSTGSCISFTSWSRLWYSTFSCFGIAPVHLHSVTAVELTDFGKKPVTLSALNSWPHLPSLWLAFIFSNRMELCRKCATSTD